MLGGASGDGAHPKKFFLFLTASTFPIFASLIVLKIIMTAASGSAEVCRKLMYSCLEKDVFQILRDILGDSDRQILLHLTMEKGECALLFPGYVDKVRENTMARQITIR